MGITTQVYKIIKRDIDTDRKIKVTHNLFSGLSGFDEDETIEEALADLEAEGLIRVERPIYLEE
jgi:hypothetical protein